jgi:hypothetical protein
MEDMEPPGCPDPARVVIFNISPLANLAKSDSLLRDLSSNFSASNLSPPIPDLRHLSKNHITLRAQCVRKLFSIDRQILIAYPASFWEGNIGMVDQGISCLLVDNSGVWL